MTFQRSGWATMSSAFCAVSGLDPFSSSRVGLTVGGADTRSPGTTSDDDPGDSCDCEDCS